MRKTIYRTLVWSLTFFSAGLFGQDTVHPVKILVDPGHGGTDSGAMGINGIAEKDIVLKVAKEIVRLNQELYEDTMEIYLSRYADTLISLGDRTRLGKVLGTEVMVSLHCNHAPRTEAQGIEVFVHSGYSDSQKTIQREAYQLAEKMCQNLNGHLGFKNRGVRRANFQVLRDTRGFCPSILVELGFLSNREEADHANKDSTITAYALVILETLNSFFYERTDAGNR